MYNYTRMPDEYIHRIYTDERFRNAIAFAHICTEKGGKFSHYCAMTPEGQYIVTEEEIEWAKTYLATCKDEVFTRHRNDLLFVSMGGDYEPRYEDDPCNHRIRTEFINKDGHRYFIEVGTYGSDAMLVDSSIDRDAEIKHEAERKALYEEYKNLRRRDPKWEEYRKRYTASHTNVGYNFGDIQRKDHRLKYTKQNILRLVNETFGCLFTNIVIDHYTISTNDREIICYSPKENIDTNKIVTQLELF